MKGVRRDGFTLVEILIVVFIISLIVVTVVANFVPRVGLQNKATQLAYRANQYFKLCQDLAIFEDNLYGFRVHKDRLQFYEWNYKCLSKQNDLTRSCKQNGFWRPTTLKNLVKLKRPDIRLSMQLFTSKNDPNLASPQVIFHPDGEVTPFTLEITDERRKPFYRLIHQGTGDLTIVDLGNVE